ncbi:MAG: hypothetical protein KKA84_16210 [Bacteroidetes bacterium]|nr:hypothetical protein [Bacteroidota bacterium]
MGISIDPTKIYNAFKDSRRSEKDDIIKFLEDVGREAEELCDIWEKLVKLAIKKGELTDQEVQELLFDRIFKHNGRPYGRLEYFYNNMSKAIGGKISDHWMENIYDHLALLLKNRNYIREQFDKFTNIKLFPFYLNNENDDTKIEDLVSYFEALRNEVNALKSLPAIMRLADIKN